MSDWDELQERRRELQDLKKKMKETVARIQELEEALDAKGTPKNTHGMHRPRGPSKKKSRAVTVEK